MQEDQTHRIPPAPADRNRRKKGSFRKKTLFIIGLASAFLWLSCGSSQAKQNSASAAKESVLTQILRKKEMRIGLSGFVPWAMADKNGELIGFEVDVAKRVARDIGVKPVFVMTEWSGIIPALQTGKFDIIIGGMSITTERNLSVNFTIPYQYSGMSLVVNKKAGAGQNSPADFNNKNVTIAIRSGASGEPVIRRFFPKATVKRFTSDKPTLLETVNGRVTAYLGTTNEADENVKKNPGIYIPSFGRALTREPIGFAVRKGDPDFLNVLNNWITINWENGFLKERFHYWFKTKQWKDRVK